MDAANAFAIYGFYSLALGVALQIASIVKHGEGAASPDTPSVAPTVVAPKPVRFARRTRLLMVAVISLILLGSLIIGYPGLFPAGHVPAGTSSSASSSDCNLARNDGTIFVSSSTTVSIEICGQGFSVPSGPGGGLTYSYHAGKVTFTAPSSANGTTFEFWYVLLPNTPPQRVNSTTVSLDLPAGLSSLNSQITLFYSGTSGSTQPAAYPANNLAGYWALDEGLGSSVSDASGNGNAGTIMNNATWLSGAACKFGGCLGFDSAKSQYVALSKMNASFPSDDSSRSLSLWVRTATLSTQYLFIYGTAGGDGAFGLALDQDGPHTIHFASEANDCSASSGRADDGHWHQVGLVYSSGGTMQIYLDGILIQTCSLLRLDTVISQFADIGSSVGFGNPNYLNGSLDDIRMYDSALTAAQMSEIHTQTPSSIPSSTSVQFSSVTSSTKAASSSTTSTLSNNVNPVGRWTLDEGRGSVAHDSSGNGVDGVLINSPAWLKGSSCKLAACLYFSASNQGVTFPYKNYGNVISTSIWFYYVSPQSDSLDIWQVMNMGLTLAPNGGSLYYSPDVTQTATSCKYTMPLNQWVNIQTSQAGASYSIIVDGSTICSGTTLAINMADSGKEGLGTTSSGSPRALVNDFRVYSVILSPSQVSQIYTQTTSSSFTSSSSTTSTSSGQTCTGNDGSIFVSTSANVTVTIVACGQLVSVPGGAGGGLVYNYKAGSTTFVAPAASSDGKTFQYWLVSMPSLHVKVTTSDLRLDLPAGYLWNDASIEAVYG